MQERRNFFFTSFNAVIDAIYITFLIKLISKARAQNRVNSMYFPIITATKLAIFHQL